MYDAYDDENYEHEPTKKKGDKTKHFENQIIPKKQIEKARRKNAT